ncbi:sensor histidine kinase [Tropicimonas sp.]|uniref:sensor histidine kinase n=1 Tax=Tropicimonas sp. TaxID=2067044 RepID=UPI003A8C53C3
MKVLERLRARIADRVWLRLIVLLGATLFVVSSVLLALVVGLYYQRLSAAQERSAQLVGGLLQAALENAMLKRDIPGLTGIVHDLGDDPMIHQVMILDPAYEVRFASDPAQIGKVLAPGGGDDLPGGVTRAIRPVPNQPRCSVCHGPADEHPVNGILVVDHVTGDLRNEALISAGGLVVLGGVATLAASVALALGLRRIVVDPVADLANAAEAMANGDLSVRVAPRGRDEIATLGQSFNRMAENTERSQAALMRAERMSQALIDAIPDGIRVIGPDFRIRRANTAYELQTRKPLSEIVGEFCYKSSHGRDTPCPYTMVTCPVVEMAKGARRLTFRDMHRLSATRQMAVEVSAAAMDDSVVEAIRDLDEQTRISQSQRLAEIGLLATGVAHEIHNPLSSIELALTALNRDMENGRSDRARRYFGLMRDEIGKCLEITDHLLQLGSPTDGKSQLVGLSDAISGVVRLLSYQADMADVEVVTDIPRDLRVLIAESDLRMAVTNLVMNAFHAMPEGGRLRLRGYRQPGRVMLEIEDTGVGIAPEHQQDIFMPFWSRRADDSTGRGLGLAITSAIAKRSGVTIAVRSTPGQGACFVLSFPDPDGIS